jgi:uncharacterized protein YndB with AHSA1/START domain
VTIDGRPALRFERRYRHPVERVWRAVTDPSEVGRWFPSEVVGERQAGAELVFDDDDQEAGDQEAGEPTRVEGPPITGRVIAHDPPNVWSVTWGGELLRFELTPDGDGTRLVFTQILSHQSVAARNGAGWHACLVELDTLLGEAPASADDDDWMPLYEDYIDRIGPELGVSADDGSMTWERATHVDPARVVTATSEQAELEGWGVADQATDALRWDIEPAPQGTVYRLTVDGIARDAERAAAWHALLLQLDMWMAAGQQAGAAARSVRAWRTQRRSGCGTPARSWLRWTSRRRRASTRSASGSPRSSPTRATRSSNVTACASTSCRPTIPRFRR